MSLNQMDLRYVLDPFQKQNLIVDRFNAAAHYKLVSSKEGRKKIEYMPFQSGQLEHWLIHISQRNYYYIHCYKGTIVKAPISLMDRIGKSIEGEIETIPCKWYCWTNADNNKTVVIHK